MAECWSLDPTGNWKKFLEDDNGDGTWDLDQSRTANDVNEITDITETAGPSWVTPAYSKEGNMTTMPQPSAPTSSYTATYDAWNRLVKLVDGANTVAEYEYDAAKRRTIKKSYTGGTLNETRHLFYTEPSKWQVIEERIDTSANAEKQYVWGLRYIDDIVLRDRDTTGNGTLDERLYGLQDANWNVTALCNISGVVQERFAYSAYGTPMFLNASFTPQTSSTSDWQTLYAGYRYDVTVELFHVRNRVYNPILGTWIQRDPYGYTGTKNLFLFVEDTPLIFSDPSGGLAERNCRMEAGDECFKTYPHWYQFAKRVACIVGYTDGCSGSYIRTNFPSLDDLCKRRNDYVNANPTIQDALTCLCFIFGTLDIVNSVLPIGGATRKSIELIDCTCNAWTTLNNMCTGTFEKFTALMILTGFDCLADAAGKWVGDEWVPRPGLEVAVDIIAAAAQNAVLQNGNPLPSTQLSACWDCSAAGIKEMLEKYEKMHDWMIKQFHELSRALRDPNSGMYK